jgi:hypothetical protein
VKFHFIQEPLLEFGQNTHICPRAGITQYDVYDTRFVARRDRILVGAVGTSETLARLSAWLDTCANQIPPKADSRQPNLYVPFCGFNAQSGFKASVVLTQEITRTLNNSEINKIIKIKRWNERVDTAVEMYQQEVKFLAQNRVVDVIVCVLPTKLYKTIAQEEREPMEGTAIEEEQEDILETNFRRALKAKTMNLGKPLQIMHELSLESNPKTQQDDATKAWNFCTALYYKANQTVPWKLMTNINRPAICFVGIGFYRSRDKKVLNTSLAQIFDELGNGVILRGTPVDVDKTDRQPHLTSKQAYDLLSSALAEYEFALGTSPGRLVMHKSSNYTASELDGFREATSTARVKTIDFVTILDTDMRLFRRGIYPPYRGSHIEFDESTHLLYTRGAVKYYQTYPGLYIPQPIEIRIVEAGESPGVICQELLGLTKMNWNNTQFDGKYPITIQCARNVGQIMKYLGRDDKPQIRYSFYM